MVDTLKDNSKYVLKYGNWKNNLSKTDFEVFSEITGNSVFTLCPRGYGKNSFRMYECMQFGSIPVYIYDDDWRPFKNDVDWDSFSISIHVSNLQNIDKILTSISDEKKQQMFNNVVEYYNNFFTLESFSKRILSNL
jgi:hypothetical protein